MLGCPGDVTFLSRIHCCVGMNLDITQNTVSNETQCLAIQERYARQQKIIQKSNKDGRHMVVCFTNTELS